MKEKFIITLLMANAKKQESFVYTVYYTESTESRLISNLRHADQFDTYGEAQGAIGAIFRLNKIENLFACQIEKIFVAL